MKCLEIHPNPVSHFQKKKKKKDKYRWTQAQLHANNKAQREELQAAGGSRGSLHCKRGNHGQL